MHINEPKSDMLKALGAEELPLTVKELKIEDLHLPTMIEEMDYYKLATMTPEEKEAFYVMKREALSKALNILMSVRLRGTNDAD